MAIDSFLCFLGITFLIITACFDAFGYNVQRRDHCKNAISAKPRHECFRIYWHMGLYIYILSLVIGNIAAMMLVPPHWVAPIATSSLVFNIIFARLLVGSVITKRDILGTAVILAGIIAIVYLTTQHDPDSQGGFDISYELLQELFSKTSFQIYFSILNAVMLSGFFVYLYLTYLLKNPSNLSSAPSFLAKMDPKILTRNTALLVSILGGMGASETVILAKSGVSLLTVAFTGEWPFFYPLPIGVVIGLALSALFQLYCLNAGLKLADSVIVGPIFSSIYNLFALLNALVFLDQFLIYSPMILSFMALSVCLLIAGIAILASQVKPAPKRLPILPRFKCTRRKKALPSSFVDFNEDASFDVISLKEKVATTS